MAYFDNFPNINYPIVVDGKPVRINSKNIALRTKFLDYVKSGQTSYRDYTIKDGERPETLANRLYGRPDLHWVILLFNDILNPLFDWPLSSGDLGRMIRNKYKGKAIFINSKVAKFGNQFGISKPANEELWYEIGQKVYQTRGSAVAQGTVKDWDPNLYKIVLDSDTISGSFSVTPNITVIGNDVFDLTHDRTDGVSIYASVGKVVEDNIYAVHHFVDTNTGRIIDHHAKILTSDSGVVDSSILDRYAVYGNEVIPLAGRNIVSVSNYQYETEKNDTLRNIKILRPGLIDTVIKDMRSLLSA